ncbi:MAG: bifunctional phosphoribosylaminoimidazolecarboxamide formyltransferase/IMP cyclohydrolase [Bdellovibrionales bacterium]|nr:bifunctional phosphoribosylaminoimidazolecarboxamide formyltransferase/IMP cyclohydrolase [Bdellovibrionales bacterium]
MNRYAIVSVWDKTGILPLVQELCSRGVKILSTGGTAKHLEQNGIEVVPVSSYTGHPEIMDGRVKTLHPKVHGGILARRDRDDDTASLNEVEAGYIDYVVVSLYPFLDKVNEVEAAANPKHESLVEFIDIGGPTMLRAAAKNCKDVTAICRPSDYQRVIDELRADGEVSLATRRLLAARVFATMSAYDGAVARYFSLNESLLDENGAPHELAPFITFALERDSTLRYGENPHQDAGLYRLVSVGDKGTKAPWELLQGKEISYNNLLDMQGALGIFLEVWSGNPGLETAVIIKHSNPCGVAVRGNILDAFKEARSCDPLSAFGGIIALSGTVDVDLVQVMLEGFIEVVLASDYTAQALEEFKKKKNVRVIKCDFASLTAQAKADSLSIRNAFGDYLVQTGDAVLKSLDEAEVVSELKPSDNMQADLRLAWQICKHVKSNTIVIVKDGKAIGVGAGQMSRVDAANFALQRAKTHGHDPVGSVAASDAFLPFSDTLEVLNDGGVAALIQPGGSIKDEDVVAAANSRKMVMLLTGERHFRH